MLRFVFSGFALILWQLTAQALENSSQPQIDQKAGNNSTQFGEVHGTVVVNQSTNIQEERQQLILECERLAASPNDLRKPQGISGIRFQDLQRNPSDAVNVCAKALSMDGNNPRLLANNARALSAAGNNKEAFVLYRKSADMNEPIAMTNLAGMYLDGTAPLGKDEATGVDLYRRASSLGSPFADYQLGQAAEFGLWGLPEDIQEAVRRYEIAAKYEISEAIYALGLAYLYGKGVPLDKIRGIELVAQSAELGYEEAVRFYAAYIADGSIKGVSSDRAVNIIRNLVDNNEPSGFSMLADFYLIGIGTPRHNETPLLLFERGAELGDSFANQSLGEIYLYGERAGKKLVTPDSAKALQYFEKCAEQKLSPCMVMTAVLYLDGVQGKANTKTAYAWAQQAHSAGNRDGTFLLGAIYKDGVGVKRDIQMAKNYLKQAADQGHEEAKKLLIELDK